jgi:FKBP-type peptidyl-prolyl cis-trans isomerase FkpA
VTAAQRSAALLLALALAGCSEAAPEQTTRNEKAATAGPGEPPSAAERDLLYALGGWLARDLAGVKITESDLPSIQEGLADALLRRPLRVQPRDVGAQVQGLLGERRAALALDEKRAGAPLLAEARARPGARRTTNGAIVETLAEGEGASPTFADFVKVQYRGLLRDGTTFDSTYERTEPAVFGMKQVVPCWSEALQLMKPGGRARLTCPSDLAYGDRGLPGRILPGATLRFEIELVGIVPAAEAKARP